MITLRGNSIVIPQGETGAISFTFKNDKTHSPLALAKIEYGYNHYIKFRVAEGSANKQAKIIIEKIYDINFITDLNTAVLPPIFEDTDVSQKDKTLELVGTVDDDQLDGKDAFVLYRIKLPGTGSYAYKYKDVSGNEYFYEYNNATVDVQFDIDDTIELQPKIYYYSIVHEVFNPDGELCVQETFIEPSEFRVIGAI